MSAPLADGFVNGGVSFWYREGGIPEPGAPLGGDVDVDVAIVGAGYTGLWTAYYLKSARPDLRIAVLEKEFAGFGASGRNGGWLLGEPAGDPARYAAWHGREATQALRREMFATVDEVISVTRAEDIEADIEKGGVLTVATNPAQDVRLRTVIADARQWGLGEEDLRLLDTGEREERLRVSGAISAAFSPHCARIQPAKLARGLADAVRRLGVTIYERTPVTEIVPRLGGPVAMALTPHGVVRAEYVLRATEGFTSSLRDHGRIWLPMNSSMIVTAPLPVSVWSAIGWDGAELLGDMAHYYMYAQRTADDRIAFGGRGKPYLYGSRVDKRGRTHQWTIDALWALLTRMFPAAAVAQIEHTWSGVLGVPRDWCASAALYPSAGIGWAGGYTGHGVAAANLSGRTLRDLVLGDETQLTALPWVGRRALPTWEPEPLRWLGVHAIYRLYRMADAREDAGQKGTSLWAKIADQITGR